MVISSNDTALTLSGGGKTYTKGNVIVEEINIGDIHYEYEYGLCTKSKVITKPELNEEGCWVWQSEETETGRIIDYLVNPEYTQYSVNLYDYEAYSTWNLSKKK